MVSSDLSGSTALGERLDPESLSRVMGRYDGAMRALVRDAAEVEPPRVLALPGRQACRVASAPGMGTTVELWLPRS